MPELCTKNSTTAVILSLHYRDDISVKQFKVKILFLCVLIKSMQYLGPLSTLLLISTVLFILKRWGVNTSATFSDHVSKDPAHKIFAISCLFYTAGFIAWLNSWNKLPVHIFSLFVIAVTLFALNNFIPRKDKHIFTHDLTANLFGALFILGILSIVLSSSFKSDVRIFVLVCSIFLAILAPQLLIRDKPYYLLKQLTYGFMMHVVILVSYYLSV